MREGDAGARLRAAARRAQGGDAGAFRELVERSHETVFRLAAALVGDRDEAADVVQETYIRAWDRLEELREPDAVLGWLCRVARNCAQDRRRAWWSRIRAPLEEGSGRSGTPDGAPGPDEALARAESAAAVRRALSRLPEKHRVVLVLREVEGLTYDEIAEALGVPVGTVESRLHRARAGLARCLARTTEEEP